MGREPGCRPSPSQSCPRTRKQPFFQEHIKAAWLEHRGPLLFALDCRWCGLQNTSPSLFSKPLEHLPADFLQPDSLYQLREELGSLHTAGLQNCPEVWTTMSHLK